MRPAVDAGVGAVAGGEVLPERLGHPLVVPRPGLGVAGHRRARARRAHVGLVRHCRACNQQAVNTPTPATRPLVMIFVDKHPNFTFTYRFQTPA